MPYNTSGRSQAMGNIQQKADEVTAACKRKLATDDIVHDSTVVKSGYFQRLFGVQTQAPKGSIVFGWMLSSRRQKSDGEIKRSDSTVNKREYEMVFLTKTGKILLVEEEETEDHTGGYKRSSTFKETVLRPTRYDILDYTYAPRRRRNRNGQFARTPRSEVSQLG